MTGNSINYSLREMNNIVPTKTFDENLWFRRWFDSAFYHKLYSNRNEKEAADFIDGLVRELQPPPYSRMLDLGCGKGRHSKWLASKGFDVSGIDLAASSIREAKKWETEGLRFYRQDMRSPFGKNSFDYVFNFFTSFGYFTDSSDDDKVVRNISSALKPGGLLVMDYINSPYTENRLTKSEKKEVDGILYQITRWTDENFFFKKINIADPIFGKPLEYTEQVKKFTFDDFERLFNNNGLQILSVFGDYQLSEYDKETSPRIILIAKKA